MEDDRWTFKIDTVAIMYIHMYSQVNYGRVWSARSYQDEYMTTKNVKDGVRNFKIETNNFKHELEELDEKSLRVTKGL